MGVGTGHGASISLASLTLAYAVRRIGEMLFNTPPVQSSHLGTVDWHEYLPGDLAEHSPIDVEVLFSNDADLPTKGTEDTMTITFPLRSGETTAATLAGLGHFTQVGYPSFVTNELQAVTLQWQWKTKPTFTAAT